MKSIVVFADQGPAMSRRLEAALDIARAHGAHIRFLIVTPYSSYVLLDPMGGAYLARAGLEAITAQEDALAAQIETEMANEDVSWDIVRSAGEAVAAVIEVARLADLIVVSLGSREAGRKPHSLLDPHNLTAQSRCPVLGVPDSDNRFASFGRAAIAWNGSDEAAYAVKTALPMLKMASDVDIISVTREERDSFPDTELSQYLARHGIVSQLHQLSKGGQSIEEVLDRKLVELKIDWMVMGAYGHSRLREALIGGVSRFFLDDSRIPLLMSH